MSIPYWIYVQQCPVDIAITEVIIMLQSVSLVLHKNMALSAYVPWHSHWIYVRQCPIDIAITEVIIMLQSVSLVLHKNTSLSNSKCLLLLQYLRSNNAQFT